MMPTLPERLRTLANDLLIGEVKAHLNEAADEIERLDDALDAHIKVERELLDIALSPTPSMTCWRCKGQLPEWCVPPWEPICDPCYIAITADRQRHDQAICESSCPRPECADGCKAPAAQP